MVTVIVLIRCSCPPGRIIEYKRKVAMANLLEAKRTKAVNLIYSHPLGGEDG